MTAIGPRPNSRKRAAEAYQLRCAHRTWEEIAQLKGYGSTAAACKAVKRHIDRMPAEELGMARALSAGTHKLVIGQLIGIAAAAKSQGKLVTAVEALEKASNVQDRHDKLIGLHVNVPQRVEVNVTQSVSAAIDQAEVEMLEALARARAAGHLAPPPPAIAGPVIDAELVEPEEQAQ